MALGNQQHKPPAWLWIRRREAQSGWGRRRTVETHRGRRGGNETPRRAQAETDTADEATEESPPPKRSHTPNLSGQREG